MCVLTTAASGVEGVYLRSHYCNSCFSGGRNADTATQRAASGSLNNMHSCFLLVRPSKLARSHV